MGLTEINGLPTHILLVHAVIILVPITALLVLASVFWRGVHERIGVVTPLVALITLLLIPLTTHAGEWLRDRVPRTPRIEHHVQMGDSLLPWAFGLFVLAVASWYLRHRAAAAGQSYRAEGTAGTAGTASGAGTAADTSRLDSRRALPPAASIIVTVLGVAVSVGAVVQLYRIGDSGAQAVWHNNYSKTSISRPHDHR